MTQPRTVWEEHDGVAAGGGGAVRAAAFPVGGDERGAVTLTVHVPDGFFAAREDGSGSATLLITATEARGFATWLEQAADAADLVGPPLYE